MPYGKINKKEAQQIYEKGGKVWLYPSNATPGSNWFSGIMISFHEDMPREFMWRLEQFRKVYCSKETGLGIHFYQNR